ncbi:MAG: hypothetical protein C6W58_04290 [Bacillaceae bacterium]|jgi:hypothetical protein|uniref:Uncharacterized protein n=1 Tax=Aeribacillus pallidus TaxID=33936 RepID=A0A165X1P8_9BACI|nr:hypothetical protein AZI98_13900 [Aeribacillus pallidus]REJ19992.1 MAG: hypothetical protein C6W58_04290 [Bacillaceae bacterium]REJ22909.1 MAG: hypothetical protein C6W54_12745 [Bacillaceae bacterium]TVZ84650.1 hypothetical protein FB379_10818 [Aeribacillus composti]
MFLNIENAILEYLKAHPGASAQKMLKNLNAAINTRSTQIKQDTLQTIVFKKLRVLKRKQKVLNKGNSWYICN